MADADPQKTFNMHEAKTNLSRLVERAAAGEEIIVAKDGKPRARLMPLAPEHRPRRRPGRFAHLLKHVSFEDVTAPAFSEEELNAIENASLFPPER